MMKPRHLLMLGALATASSGLDARVMRRGSAPSPARTVQLISMLQAAPMAAPEAVDAAPSATADSDAPPMPDAFRVHDLSRRWVEYQMRESLVPLAQPAALRQDDPFAPQMRAAGPAAAAPLPMFSAIAVPSWMHPMPQVAAVPFAPGCVPAPYRPSGFLGLSAEARRQAYYGMMSSIACQYGLPVGLFDAMIIRESRYDPLIVSPKKAYGLTQLMPDTAAGLGVDRFDIEQNLRGGASYLRRQLDHFGQYHLALAAYNAGPGRVLGAVPGIPETRAYVDDILRNWSRLSGFQQSAVVQNFSVRALAARAEAGRGATVLSF